MEVFFSGLSHAMPFTINFCELLNGRPNNLNSLSVYSYPAIHTAGTEARSLRVKCDGRILSYSGDTEWNDNLIEVVRLADLFICEGFSYRNK
jgi:ribonuclease BN (tRNA processing enzyme)